MSTNAAHSLRTADGVWDVARILAKAAEQAADGRPLRRGRPQMTVGNRPFRMPAVGPIQVSSPAANPGS